MSDDPAAKKTNGNPSDQPNGNPDNPPKGNPDNPPKGNPDNKPQGTILGDNAGVFIPSRDEDDEPIEVPADFGSFVVSLGTNCMINLGRIEHPETGQTQTDLDSAKHTIEIIEMLQQKTEGNLDAEEQKLIESLLYDLRSAFVQQKKAKN